jgi:hypothetical protein
VWQTGLKELRKRERKKDEEQRVKGEISKIVLELNNRKKKKIDPFCGRGAEEFSSLERNLIRGLQGWQKDIE